jgi:hypothetical protein
MFHFNLTSLKDHWEVNCREMKDYGKRRLGDFTHMKVDKHVAVNTEVFHELICLLSLALFSVIHLN